MIHREQHQPHPPGRSCTLADLADRFDCRLSGRPDIRVNTVATLQNAGPEAVSFLANPRYREQLASARAGAVVVSADDVAQCLVPTLISENPYATYARIAAFLYPPPAPKPGVHSTAVAARDAEIPASSQVDAYAVLGAGSHLGEAVVVGPGCVIGPDVQIGDGSRLLGHVTVLDRVVVGRRALIHPGVVLGADGFGFAAESSEWTKVPQLGNVRIGDDVEIGANTTIDRGAIDDTVIEDGVKLDNQIQIAHNVHVGEHTVIAGMTGVAGSTRIGKRCLIAGGVVIIGHLIIDDDVTITVRSVVTHSLKGPAVYSSTLPAQEASRWRKNVARFRNLDSIITRFATFEKKLRSSTKS